MTKIVKGERPFLVERSFVVKAVARNQSFPCGGCFYRPSRGTCLQQCDPSWESRPFSNFKRVRDGETVVDEDGVKFLCRKSGRTEMDLLKL